MYTILKKFIAVCCAFLLVSFFLNDAKAATASEDETESTTSDETSKPGTIDLDVPSFLVRYLYREPDIDEVPIKRWYDGWGWSMYWNPDVLAFGATSYVNKFHMSVKGVGLALSKDFNKYGGIRVGANFSSVACKDPNAVTVPGVIKEEENLKRANVSLDYLWNLSNTYYGYDLHRTTEWLLTGGAKVGKLLEQGDLFYAVTLGAQFRKNIANDWSFFIEPQFAFFTDKYDNNETFYEVDPGANLLVGLYFRMGNPKMQILDQQNQILGNSYFQAMAGAVNGRSTYAFNSLTGHDYAHHHLNFGFNVGSWFNPALGFRFGYFENIMGIGYSKTLAANGYGPTASQTYRGGRAEIVMNPLTIVADKTSIGRFGWDLSVGYEVGNINKHKEGYDNHWTASGPEADKNHINYLAYGVTFATQLKYYLSKNYAIFAEGRYSNPMYSAKVADDLSDGTMKVSGDLDEKLFSWALGMEYYISTFERYTRFEKHDNHNSREIGRLSQDHRWYFEMAGGLGAATHWGEYFKQRSSFSSVLALGINYNDYSGLRTRFSATRKFIKEDPVAHSQIQGDIYQFTLGLDYMFNLTNLWWGRDEENTRWSDIYLFAGPTIQLAPHDLRSSLTLKNAYGGEVGAQFTRRLSKGVELFVEPRYEYNFGAASRWNALAGLKLYQYKEKNRRYRDSIASHDKDSWFLEVSGGAGIDIAGVYGKTTSGSHTPDLDFRLGVGYRMNPVSSFRLNAQAIFYSMFKGNGNGKKAPEISFDYMANLLNLWYGNNPHRLFKLYGYFGPVLNPESILEARCTKDIAYDWKLGAEGGLQLVYSPFQNVSMYLEPRLSYYVSDYLKKSGREMYWDRRDEHLDLYAGLIFYNQPGSLPLRGYRTTDEDSTRTWYYEMGAGYTMTPSGRTGNVVKTFSPSAYVGLGHYLTNYSSWRTRLALVRMLNPENMGYKTEFVTGVSLDYLYNLSNRMLGVNPYRRFDLSLYGGPVAEFYNSQITENDKWDYGANFGGQLAWHVNNYIDLFGEGRFISSLEHHTRYETLVGFKLYQNKQKTNQFRDSLSQHAYTWFMEAAGGAGEAFTDQQNKRDGVGKIAFGYRYNPLSSLRVGAALWERHENEHLYSRQEISADYMINLLNLWYGVNPFRRVNFRVFAGPNLTFNNFVEKDMNVELNLGYQAGFQLTAGLTRNIDLLLEPRYTGVLSGVEKNTNRGDVFAGLIFYNQRGLLPYLDYNTINVDSERGWYMEVAGGANFIPDGRIKGDIPSVINPIGHLALGHFLGDYSNVRLRGGLGYNRNISNFKKPERWFTEFSLDYLYNITNSLLGVNPYRRFDFSLYAGPLAQVSGLRSGNFDAALGVNGGGQLAWHINNYVDFIVEPRVTCFQDNKYYSRYEALGGFRVYQNKSQNVQYIDTEAPHANTWFMELGAGAGTAFENQRKPDMAFKGAVGYRYNPYSSLRLNGHFWAGKDLDHLQGKEVTRRSMEVSADYMVNVLNVFYGVNPERRYALRGFIGGNATADSFLSEKSTHWLLGFDFGAQASYALTDNIDLFVEPRVESYLNSGRTPRFDTYAGLIFYNQRGLLPMHDYQSTDIDDHFTWFSELGGGMSFNVDGRLDDNYRNHFDLGAHAAVGMHFSNYSSARFRGSLVSVRKAEMTKDKRDLLPVIGLEYMHNMTNTLMGYNPYRRFDLNVFAGPTALLKGLSNFRWNPFWGLSAGSQLSWHMNDRWDMFGELRTLLSHNFDSRLEAFGGIAYRYNKRSMRKAHFDIVPDKLYVQMLLGMELCDVEHFGSDAFQTYKDMPTFNYNVGYRVNKMLGVQAGLYSDHFTVFYSRPRKGRPAVTQDLYSYGLRAEGVLNIINMFKPGYDAKENRFNWNVTAGAQIGRNRSGVDNNLKYGYGLTGATQVQYRVFSHSWVLAEMRAQAINTQRGLALPITAQIGMMYDFNSQVDKPTDLSNVYVQGGAGTFESKCGTMEFGLGYDFTPVHGARVNYDMSLKEIDGKSKWTTISPDYVCNLSNLFWGHDEDNRHVDLSVLAGVDFILKSPGEKSSNVGFNAGMQLTYNINKYLQFYTEPRFSHQVEGGLNMQTNFGLKYRLPKVHFNFKKGE